MKRKIIQSIIYLTLLIVIPSWAWTIDILTIQSDEIAFFAVVGIVIFGILIPIIMVMIYISELINIWDTLKYDSKSCQKEKEFKSIKDILLCLVPLTVTFKNIEEAIVTSETIKYLKELKEKEKIDIDTD
jgi:hypothetical protein